MDKEEKYILSINIALWKRGLVTQNLICTLSRMHNWMLKVPLKMQYSWNEVFVQLILSGGVGKN